MTGLTDGPVGFRLLVGFPPGWEQVEQLWRNMAAAINRGDRTQAVGHAQQIRDQGLRAADGVGLDFAARATPLNLSSFAAENGDLEAAVQLAGEATSLAARALTLVGDQRLSSDTRSTALLSRAQHLQALGRLDESLRDLDEAEASLTDASANAPLLRFNLHNSRAVSLLSAGRFAEADAQCRLAVDLAMTCDPRLASHAWINLAGIAGRTGDSEGVRDYLLLARDLPLDDDVAAEIDHNLAVVLLQLGDIDAAEQRLHRAQAGLQRAAQARLAASSRRLSAEVLLARGKHRRARAVATEVLAELQRQGDVFGQAMTHLLLAASHADQGNLTGSEESYLAARELYAGAGVITQVARVDVARAQAALAVAQRIRFRSTKEPLLRQALDVALAASLATDALRHSFPAGPARERWVTEVAQVALAVTLQVAFELEQTRVALAVLEHLASSAAVAHSPDPAGSLGAIGRQPSRVDYRVESLALAASGPAGQADPAAVVPTAPLPRVRSLPGDDSFDVWIEEAERRYGFPVRSAEVIDAW